MNVTNNKLAPPDLKSSWYFDGDTYFSRARIVETQPGKRSALAVEFPSPDLPLCAVSFPITKRAKQEYRIKERGTLSGVISTHRIGRTRVQTVSTLKRHKDATLFYPAPEEP